MKREPLLHMEAPPSKESGTDPVVISPADAFDIRRFGIPALLLIIVIAGIFTITCINATSLPSARGDSTYVGTKTKTSIYVGTKTSIYAINPITGDKLWQHPISAATKLFYDDAPSFLPLPSGGVIVESDHTLQALHDTSGAVDWGIPAPSGATLHLMAIDGNTLYAAETFDGQHPGTLMSINATTGATRWVYHLTTGNPTAVTTFSGAIALGSSVAGFPTNAPSLFLLDAQSGTVRWQTLVSSALFVTPRASDRDLIYTNVSSNHLSAFATTDGIKRWTLTTGPDQFPTIANGIVFDSSLLQPQHDDHTLHTFSATDLTPIWNAPMPKQSSYFVMTFGTGKIAVNTADGLVALDMLSGKTQWQAPVIESYHLVASDDGNTVFSDEASNLSAIDAKTGALLWRYHTSNANGPFSVVYGATVLLLRGNTLDSLQTNDGRKVWQADLPYDSNTIAWLAIA